MAEFDANGKATENKKRVGKYKTNNIKTSEYLPGVFNTDLNQKWLDATLDQMVRKGDLQDVDAFIGSKHGKYRNKKDETYLTTNKLGLTPAIVTKDISGEVINKITFDDIANSVNSNFNQYNYNSAYSSDCYVYEPPISEDKFLNHLNYYWIPEMPVYRSYNDGTRDFAGNDERYVFSFADSRTITDVSLNGVTLTLNTDYTSTGTEVSLITIPSTGDTVTLTGAAISYSTDFLTDVQQQSVWQFSDDNGTFDLQDGMLIKLESGYDSSVIGKTYLVTGVGVQIFIREYLDENNRPRFPDATTYKDEVSSYFDPSNIVTFSRYANNGVLKDTRVGQNYAGTGTAGTSDPFELIADHNYVWQNKTTNPGLFSTVDPDPTLLFWSSNEDGWDPLVTGMVVQFDATFTFSNPLDKERIFYVESSVTSGELILTTIIDPSLVASTGSPIPLGLSESLKEIAFALTGGWDTTVYDSSVLPYEKKDYLVVAKNDLPSSAWCRVNHWIHKDVILTLERFVPEILASNYLTSISQAKRPIIEFEANLNLYNYATFQRGVTNTRFYWWGPVDFIIDDIANYTGLPVGATFVVENGYQLYTVTSTGYNSQNLRPGETLLIMDGNTSDLVTRYKFRDVYYNGSNIVLGQHKQGPNQAPLFSLYDENEKILNNSSVYPESTFNGNKLFGYKVNPTGVIDKELGFAPVYKDSGNRADLVFENFMITEKYDYVVKLTNGDSIGKRRTIGGYPTFKRSDRTQFIYNPAPHANGAWVNYQQTVTELTGNSTSVPLGRNNWLTSSEFVTVKQSDDDFTALELLNHNEYNSRRETFPNILATKGSTITIHDLIGLDSSTQLKFFDVNRNVIPVSSGVIVRTDENSDGFDETISVTVPSTVDDYYWYGYDSNTRAKIIAVDDTTYFYHKVYINGRQLKSSEYTLYNSTLTINNSLLSAGDIIDVDYKANSTDYGYNGSMPLVHEHNPTNYLLETFTIPETISHWKSMISMIPGFDGQSFGNNNNHKINRLSNHGGEIFLHNDVSVMHDLCYADPNMNISSALNNQGNEWWSFKQRFVSQIKRLYTANSYTTVKDLVNDALKAITNTRKGSTLHQDSNMVYSVYDKYQTVELDDVSTSAWRTFTTRFTFNSDENHRDHVYIYLRSSYVNDQGQTVWLERLLERDNEYTINGSEITILTTVGAPSGIGSSNPTLTVYYHNMDDESYVPVSLAKVGLSNITIPTFVGGTSSGYFYTHDGELITTPGNKFWVLQDVNHKEFDPVNAALFELEKRIYNGVVDDITKYTSYKKFLPSQHLATWYKLSDIDGYVERYFNEWKLLRGVSDLNGGVVYDATDPTTWNYNTIDPGKHFAGNTLPGYWKGAYTVLFGTSSPQLTPWHMLGFGKKPDWWDDVYSWTDATKRARLIKSLKRGLVSHPIDEKDRQDIRFARYYWDWDNKSPVKTDGSLEYIGYILGMATNPGDPPNDTVAASQEFVFGDWGPVEYEWRQSSKGQAAMLDAIIKLNPADAWAEFFQPGQVEYGNDSNLNMVITKDSRVLVNPREFRYHGKVYNRLVTRVFVDNSSDGFATDTQLFLVNQDHAKQATTIVNTNSDGEITHVSLVKRGYEYQEAPVHDLYNPTGASDASAVFRVTTKATPFWANGLNHLQANLAKRNQATDNQEQQYYSLNTQLVQKLNGFSRKNLLNVYTESGPAGKFRIGENDFDVSMYRSMPREVLNASNIIITKTPTAFIVKGISKTKQQFKMLDPKTTGNNIFENIEISAGVVLKKYRNYLSTTSIVEYGHSYTKIQDTYDFIRGYYAWLKSVGFTTQELGDSQALYFAQWALQADADDVFTLRIGDSIEFTNDGYVLEFNTMPNSENSILDQSGRVISQDQLIVQRNSTTTTISIKPEASAFNFGSINVAVVKWEHVLMFKNRTEFNEILFDNITNQRQWRLKLQGRKTKDWSGLRSAPGYLIQDNSILENWDSSVQTIDDFYDFSIENVNAGVSKAENITIGNFDKAWKENIDLDENTFSKFYKGYIKEQGTKDVVQRLMRSDVVNNGTSRLGIHEEWMFRHSYFGDTKQTSSIEIMLRPDQLRASGNIPRVVNLEEINSADIVNGNPASLTFATTDYDTYLSNRKLTTAGDLITSESKYRILNINDIGTVYDELADWANVPTWNGTTSYKRFDQIRYQGAMYECNVDYIGFNVVGSNLVFTGAAVEPVFSYADPATDPASAIITYPATTPSVDETANHISSGNFVTGQNYQIVEVGTTNFTLIGASNNTVGTVFTATGPGTGNGKAVYSPTVYSIWFDETQTVYAPIVATGVSFTTIPSPNVITIDGTNYNFENLVATQVVDTTATNSGNAYVRSTALTDPVIADNTNYELQINGTLIPMVDSTYPAGTSLDLADVIQIINDSDITGRLYAQVFNTNQLEIIYQAQGNVNATLTIGSSASTGKLNANTLLGLTPTLIPVTPTTKTTDVHTAMNATTAAAQINAITTLPSYIVASESSGAVVITKNPTSATGVSSIMNQLTIGGTANTILQLPASTPLATPTQQPKVQTLADAVTSLNDRGIPDFTASVTAGNQLRLESTGISINLGASSNDMNTQSGIGSGDFFASETSIANVFDPNDWRKLDDTTSRKDGSLFNIWIADDKDMVTATGTTDGLQSKFFGWNVLQVQDPGWYAYDSADPGCSICAGTQSTDGNDARITLNVAHKLNVGDYVMIHNSTTSPSVNGIHRVTKLGTLSEPNVFYIDMFIEECGTSPHIMVLRNSKFNRHSDVITAETSDYYFWDKNSYAFALEDSAGVTSTNVYKWKRTGSRHTGEWVLQTDRYKTRRVNNSLVESLLIYDPQQQQTVAELEIWDPLRGIFPGVAERELDNISNLDRAQYNASTDPDFDTATVLATSVWDTDEVGVTWWDTSTVRYWDYDQGPRNYRERAWGNTFTGSQFDVYEWTKSIVPPDEYDEAVTNGTEMFGKIATGTPYSQLDSSGEPMYYWSEDLTWNESTQDFVRYYYFWVKNKTTVPNTNRKYTVTELASILEDPTAFGIPWGAVLSSSDESNQPDSLILSNIEYFIKDTGTVLQINLKPDRIPHSSWTGINEDIDVIPAYWYLGLKDNLIGIQSGTGIRFPNQSLHEFNRFGDDRKLGQGWFKNILDARRNAVSAANHLLKTMNLVIDLSDTWDRNIGYNNHALDITTSVNNMDVWTPATEYYAGDEVRYAKKVYRAVSYQASSGTNPRTELNDASKWREIASVYDLTRMWDWADYVYTLEQSMPPASKIIVNENELSGIDTSRDRVVELRIYDYSLDLDRSELYQWNENTSEWDLLRKRNATIQFNDYMYNDYYIDEWDSESRWDNTGWDGDVITYVNFFVKACREDLFIRKFEQNFNKFFFSVIDYVLATHSYVDWCYKTTYVQMNITTPVNTTIKKYTKTGVDTVMGYMEQVKPFHTKVRSLYNINTIDESSTINIEETPKSVITLAYGKPDNVIDYYDDKNYGPNTVLKSAFGETATATYSGADFTDTDSYDAVTGGDFLQPATLNYQYATSGTDDNWWDFQAVIDPLESLNIIVQTNKTADTVNFTGAVDPTSRTFLYHQDEHNMVNAYSLPANMSTTLTADVTDSTIAVTDGTVFNSSGGYAWINGEVIRYHYVNGNTLYSVEREQNGTLTKNLSNGDTIVALHGNALTTIRDITQLSHKERQEFLHFNNLGKSIVDATSTNIEAVELNNTSQGIDI